MRKHYPVYHLLVFYVLGFSACRDIFQEITTERECVNSETILLDGDNFVIYFHYGEPISAVEFLECFRWSEEIFSYYKGEKEAITHKFMGRTEVTFSEVGVRVSINASTEDRGNDRANYSCNAELKGVGLVTAKKSIMSDPYGNYLRLCVILFYKLYAQFTFISMIKITPYIF